MAVLVAYASKHGSTREIAERIGETLRRMGKDVDVRPVETVGDPAGYEAAVIGSAVYFGSWMKDAAEFVRHHRDVLSQRPVWLFSSGPLGEAALPEPKEIAEFQAAIGPRDHRDFVGALGRDKLTFPERMIARAVKSPEGDFRDWAAIEAWAEGIGRALTPAGSAPGPA